MQYGKHASYRMLYMSIAYVLSCRIGLPALRSTFFYAKVKNETCYRLYRYSNMPLILPFRTVKVWMLKDVMSEITLYYQCIQLQRKSDLDIFSVHTIFVSASLSMLNKYLRIRIVRATSSCYSVQIKSVCEFFFLNILKKHILLN